MILPRVLMAIWVRLRIFKVFCIFNSPTLTSFYGLFMVKKLNSGSGKRFLCIGRPIFDDDVRALALYSKKVSVFSLHKNFFVDLFGTICPELLQSHQDFHLTRTKGWQAEKYRKFVDRFLYLATKFHKIDGILTANYNYSWQQDIAELALQRDLEFCVLFKEGISPVFRENETAAEGMRKLVNKFSNNKFIGTSLFTYNRRVARAFHEAKIPGLAPEMISVVGIPRFDHYFRKLPIAKEQKNNFLFFAFAIEDKVRHLTFDENKLALIRNRTMQFHLMIYKHALTNPEIKLIIKTKSNPKHIEILKRLYHHHFGPLPSNISIVNSGNVSDLIKLSGVVIGFNSTAMLEAHAAGRLVLSSDFKDIGLSCFYDDYPAIGQFIRSEDDIVRLVKKFYLPNFSLDTDGYKFLVDRVHFADGRSSYRLEAGLIGSEY